MRDSDGLNSRVVPRMPLVWVVMFAAMGIGCDRFLQIPMKGALVTGTVLVVFALLLSRRESSWATLLILLGVGTLFSAWHHARWHHYRLDELGLRTTEQATPIMLQGRVTGHVSHIEIRSSGLTTIPGGPETKFSIQLEQVRDSASWRNVSGRCRVIVKGDALGIGPGDTLRIVGKIQRPIGPRNPNGFSRFERARVERTLTRLVANHPACVTIVAKASSWNPKFWLARYRTSAIDSLFEYLGQERGELAAAILLGAREYLEPSRVDAFFLTGTIHLLAISGLHVGILAWGLFLLVRLSLVPRDGALLTIMLLSIAYALLTGSRAPVIRATILVVLICGQLLFYQRPVSFNGLAAAALVVLIWNPMQLFQVGAQLSFLAVAALICARPMLVTPPTTDPLQRLLQKKEGYLRSALRLGVARIRTVALVSLVVWAVTLPLVMYRFHVVAPAALMLNLVLWIPIGLALFTGFGILLFANVLPWMAHGCAAICAICLDGMECLVRFGCAIEGSYFWTVGPGLLAVCCFYGLVTVAVSVPKLRPQIGWWSSGAALLVAVSTYANSRPSPTGELRCTFLALGYGTSVVLQLPNSEVWLYDAGALGSPKSTVNEISRFLWSRGICRLDGVIISHADADHYNAVPGLLERFSVGTVCLTSGMMNSLERLPAELQESLRTADLELRVLERGNRWTSEEGVSFSVLHPDADSLLPDDNANSLVLAIDYQGRRILLPGDLERDGMLQLIRGKQLDCDVALAPHHGSRYALPVEFCHWCQPEWIVICGGQIDRAQEVTHRFDDTGARALHTAIDGPVDVKISAAGISVTSWKAARN